MELRKLHLVVFLNLFKFGLLFQLDDIKFYKPSGEKRVKIFADLSCTSRNRVKRFNDLARPVVKRYASLVFSFRFRKH